MGVAAAGIQLVCGTSVSAATAAFTNQEDETVHKTVSFYFFHFITF